MIVDPAWISSEEHVAQFRNILRDFRGTSWLRRRFLGHQMPEDFPAVRIGRKWVPIVHFSSGKLEISDSGLYFQAVPNSFWPVKYRGLREDLQIAIRPDQFKSVRWAQVEPLGLSYYATPFIHIDNNSDGAPKSFWLSAGGRGPSMKGIRDRTQALFDKLATFAH